MFGRSNKFTGPAAGLLAFLIFSLALSACGLNPNTNQLTRTAQTLGPETAAVALPPITIGVETTAPVEPPTSTPTRLNSTSPGVTIPSQPSATSTVTATPAPTPTLAPSPTPTPEGKAEKVNKDAELTLIKAGYEAIVKNLFKEPDTALVLGTALNETGRITGITPAEVEFKQDSETNWNLFKASFSSNLDAAVVKGFTYPKNQLAHRLVNTMAEAIKDEHTYFLDKNGYDNRQRLLQGNNTSIGFGIAIIAQENKAFIVRVVPGSPADKAGLKAGDQFVMFDNTTINGKNWVIVRSAKENESHNFTVVRINQPVPLTIAVTKKIYLIPTVEYRIINGHIGYVAIREFFTNVAEETNKAMVSLQKQGADSWIIDLRNNPGGVSVEQVVGRFVQGGEIMGYNINRKGKEELKVSNDGVAEVYKGKPFSPLLPMVVLINEGSASSSEIFALAAHDFNLGILIGTKTAGALGHTSATPLGDGTAISVTVDEYESKSGIKNNGVGVSPDFVVEQTISDLVSGRDLQLQAGIEQLDKTLAKH